MKALSLAPLSCLTHLNDSTRVLLGHKSEPEEGGAIMPRLLLRLEGKRRRLRGKMLQGGGFHAIGIFVLLGSFAFLPAVPAGASAAIGFFFLGLACVLTIILAPLGGCLV